MAPGPIVEPPQIEMSSLPLDDRGKHELDSNVVRAGDRFCYRYTLDRVEQSVAPILRVHPGESFAVRIVDQLHGPAPGATMAASALAPCKPQSMPDVMPHEYVGYMNHLIESRMMSMPDVDANLHFHGFEGSPLQDDVFLSALTTPAHACEYELTIPVTQPPGTYFYHPHAHGMADDEVAGGLSGMWIVESNTPEFRQATTTRSSSSIASRSSSTIDFSRARRCSGIRPASESALGICGAGRVRSLRPAAVAQRRSGERRGPTP